MKTQLSLTRISEKSWRLETDCSLWILNMMISQRKGGWLDLCVCAITASGIEHWASCQAGLEGKGEISPQALGYSQRSIIYSKASWEAGWVIVPLILSCTAGVNRSRPGTRVLHTPEGHGEPHGHHHVGGAAELGVEDGQEIAPHLQGFSRQTFNSIQFLFIWSRGTVYIHVNAPNYSQKASFHWKSPCQSGKYEGEIAA